ncbi:NAD(P)/FAD-dependent oxidoreductase [Nonomuraea fuscirosea]|uniref:FAD/NAD(P)-dependent oxidoreductase n=1 Tax=Nonomuraea fuscirosea TaxID=1291556 RepID=UPI0034257E8D
MTDPGTYDLVVVGGGPAGVAGALTAALAGLSVALVDSGPRLGGQYFRHAPAPKEGPEPGAGLARFLRQAGALTARADVLMRHQVWNVSRDPDGTLTVHCLTHAPGTPPRPAGVTGAGAAGAVLTSESTAGAARAATAGASPGGGGVGGERAVVLRGRRLLIATGAHDRPLPFPGWDLPGVLTAGGAQALLKGGGVLAGRRVVVSGTGPFLLPVATGLAGAGARVLGVYEANGGLGLARHPLLALGKAGEAAGYAAALARHRVPYRTRQAVVAAHGDSEVEAVTVARLDAGWNVLATRVVRCDALAVGYGFVPQIELGTQLGCATRHDVDGSPVLAVDATLRTSIPGVWAAGEPVGVGGWRLAELEGRLAGRAIAEDVRLSRRAFADEASLSGGAAAEDVSLGRAAAGDAGLGRGVGVGDAGLGRGVGVGGAGLGRGVGVGGAGLGRGVGAQDARSARRGLDGVLARRRERWRAFGEALQRAYPVRPGWQGWLRDDTIVCRCEEVPLARVREAQRLGATDARSIKLLARPGMGWCQGRVCGYAVSCLAGERPQPPRRPIAQPVALGALATIEAPGTSHPGPDGDGPLDAGLDDSGPHGDGPRSDGLSTGGPHDGGPHDGGPHDGGPHDGGPRDGRPHDGRPHDGAGEHPAH